MNLSDRELALCVAALENAAKDLQRGCDAAIRLNEAMPDLAAIAAKEMIALKDKMMNSALEHS